MGNRMIASTNGFKLGIDWSNPSEQIDIQSLTQAEQCEYDHADSSLKTVSGVRIAYDVGMPVETLYYDIYRKTWYFSSSGVLYETDLSTHKRIGELSGNSKPKYHAYDGKILIASGGKLQAIIGSGTLETIEGSQQCDFVSSRSGRVITTSVYSHKLSWSAIGDYKSWANNQNDTSSAQYVEIGYKDQGCIVAVDFLTKAVVVYKEYGRVYQVIGTPDNNLAVYPLSETGYCNGAAISIDDRSYYLGASGLMSFTPTNTYAEIQPFETGLNINAWLLSNLSNDCKMWHVQNRKQLWIKPTNSGTVFLYHYIPRYNDGRGVFTTRTFIYDLHDVVNIDKSVYIAYGNKIGVLDETIDTDDGVQIKTSIVSGNRLATRLFILILNYNFVAHNIIEGYGTIGISDKTPKRIEFKEQEIKLYNANDLLNEDDDKLFSDEYTKVYKIGGGANRNVQFKLFVQKGAISLRQLDYVYEEV